MKKLFILFFGLVIVFLHAGKAVAQSKATVEIGTVKETGKNVNFTLTSSKQFIVGNNVYVLHIDDKVFWLYEQTENNEKGILIFHIPAEDFNNLKEGSAIYLTYGNKSMEEGEMKEMCKQEYFPCWSLGQFSKNLLTK
jgi:hypothetical protein